MIDRYKTKEMADIWSEESKFKRWSRIETTVCSVLCDFGEISEEVLKEIESTPAPSPERVAQFEAITNHDVVAFINAFTEHMSPAAQQAVHRGLTSSDVCDTALSMAMYESIELLMGELGKLANILKSKADNYKDLPCIGRTHGMHAEPSVFGLKFLGWLAECNRNQDRLSNVMEEISHGKLSGAVGTYSQNDPDLERSALAELGLYYEDIATQVIPRDRHANAMSILALIGAMIERIGLEIRSLQRTEVNEVEEKFAKGQAGSSAMPHKHNPILSERLCGMARLLRGYMLTAYENVALWHERDISHSSVERIIIPDAFHLTHYMIIKTQSLIENLVVFEKNVEKNIYKTRGMIYSQNILTWLISKGLTRIHAYQIVKQAAQMVMDGDCNMGQAVSQILPSDLLNYDNLQELSDVMNNDAYLKNIDAIYTRI